MKNEKFLSIFITTIFFLIFSATLVSADSTYVLPYPSSMPGSLLYKIHLVKEKLMKYWYFGNFGQFEYNLKLSDKYLVEAKTLFDYKQYLLAYQALQKSDVYFKNIPQYLDKAKKENKNTKRKQNILKEAGKRHMEELNDISLKVPSSFIWKPEKSSPINLNIKDAIQNSIGIRKFLL